MFLKEINQSIEIIKISFLFIAENPSTVFLSAFTIFSKIMFVVLETYGLLIVLNSGEQKFNQNFFLADLTLNNKQIALVVCYIALILWHFNLTQAIHQYTISLKSIMWNYEGLEN